MNEIYVFTQGTNLMRGFVLPAVTFLFFGCLTLTVNGRNLSADNLNIGKGDGFGVPNTTFEWRIINYCDEIVKLAVFYDDQYGERIVKGWATLKNGDAFNVLSSAEISGYYAFNDNGVWDGEDSKNSLRLGIDPFADFLFRESEPQASKVVKFKVRNLTKTRETRITCKN